MKLSESIAAQQKLLEEHGDLDLLDGEDWPIARFKVEQASEGQLQYWGMDLKVPFKFVRIVPDN